MRQAAQSAAFARARLLDLKEQEREQRQALRRVGSGDPANESERAAGEGDDVALRRGSWELHRGAL